MSTWIKVYNSMPHHPKFVGIGPQAGWLFVCGLCYSNEHLTDGFIPSASLHVVAPSVRRPRPLADRLASVGLWLPVNNGWQIHDYSEHQRSAAEVRERRRKDRERKGFGKPAPADSARNPDGIRKESTPTPQGIRDLDVDVESRKQKAERENTSVLVRDCFVYWQERCSHPTSMLTPERRRAIEGRLKQGYTVEQIRQGIDGAAVGAHVNEKGKRFDDIELICRNGTKLESFIDRASAKPAPGRRGGDPTSAARSELPVAAKAAAESGDLEAFRRAFRGQPVEPREVA